MLSKMAAAGLLAFGAAGAARLAWVDKSALPTPAAGGYTASSGSEVFYAGGTTWRDGVKHWLRDVYRYDAAKDKWSTGPALPVPLAYGGRAFIDGAMEIYGGFDGQRVRRECWRLDAAKNRWNAIGPLASDPLLSAAVNFGGQAYLFGGCPDVADLTHCTDAVYAREKGQWRNVSKMPGGPVSNLAAASTKDAVYLFGGCVMPSAGKVVNRDDAYRFDPHAATWKKLRPLPHTNRGLTAIALDDRHILIMGGYTATMEEAKGKATDFGFTSDVLIYDTVKDEYHAEAPLPLAVSGMEPVLAGRTVIAIGGEHRMRDRTARVLASRF